MELLNLSSLKKHLLIEHDEDDETLTFFGDSAESMIKTHLSITGSFSGSLAEWELPLARLQAFEIVATRYENRGSEKPIQLNLSIINPLRDTL